MKIERKDRDTITVGETNSGDVFVYEDGLNASSVFMNTDDGEGVVSLFDGLTYVRPNATRAVIRLDATLTY